MGLEKVGAAIAAGAASAVERLCMETAENAKALCPVGSGELKGSIAPQVMGPSGSVAAGAGQCRLCGAGNLEKGGPAFFIARFCHDERKSGGGNRPGDQKRDSGGMNLSAEGEKRRILEALGSIETLKNVSRSWPRQQAALPCAVVTLAGERRADERDGAEYLTETEYYVRCFARTGTEADELAPKIRREMEKLGYQREFAWEESSEAVFQRVERYKKWIG